MSIVKTVSLIFSAASGFKKLYDLIKRKILAFVRKEAIDKAVHEKDTSDLERIVNDR